MPSDPYSTLSDSDLQQLQIESGLSEATIKTRGYYRCTSKAELKRLGFADAQCLTPCLVLPMHGVDGKRHDEICQIRPDDPRVLNGKKLKYETPRGAKMRLDVHPSAQPLLRDPAVAAFHTEGIKSGDAIANQGYLCITLLGVFNFRGTNSKGGKATLEDYNSFPLNRTHYIVYDSDARTNANVRIAQDRLASMLRNRGGTVRFILLPSGPGGKKMGIDDHLAQKISSIDDLILESVDELPWQVKEEKPKLEVVEGGAAARPVVVCNDRFLIDITRDAVAALCAFNADATIMVRNRRLVAVERSESGYSIEPCSFVTLRTKLSMAADWVREEGEKIKKVSPPKDVVESVLELGDYPAAIPILAGISAAPRLSPTGTFHRFHGYDPASGYFITGDGPWPEWEGDARSAAEFLVNELFVDFPFHDRSSCANSIALLLTPFLRSEIHGQVPLFFINAAMKESGKTVLAQSALCPGTGSMFEVSDIPTNDEEIQKTLLALLEEGHPSVILDNLNNTLISATLDKCLTTGFFRARILGTNRSRKVATNAIFVVTANNGKLSDDLLRRAVYISLDSVRASFEHRSDWKHKPFLEWVAANEALLASAAMAMIEAWVKAGKPNGSISKNSYERWSLMIGGILAVAGVHGFIENDEALSQDAVDATKAQWGPFLEKAVEVYGMYQDITSGDLCKLALDNGYFDAIFAKANNDRGRSAVFGKAITKQLNAINALPRVLHHDQVQAPQDQNVLHQPSTTTSTTDQSRPIGYILRPGYINRGLTRYTIFPYGGEVENKDVLRIENKKVFDDKEGTHNFIHENGKLGHVLHHSTTEGDVRFKHEKNGGGEQEKTAIVSTGPDFSVLDETDQPDADGWITI